jgi:hypothetical protein
MLTHLQINPAGCPVNSHEEITLLVFVRHLGKVFDVNMNVARLIVLERLVRRF